MGWPRHILQRPSWWTPENVLARLQSGEHALAICRDASSELADKVAPSTFRSDISKWANSASWGDQFTAALALRRSAETPTFTKDWYDDFFLAMEESNGEVETACTLAGVTTTVVYAVLDRRNRCYDADFAERFRIAEGARMGRIREAVLADAQLDSALGLRVLQSSMPSLHAPKQQVEVSGTVEHDHVVRLDPAIIAASQQRMRTLMSGRVERAEREVKQLPAQRQTITVTANEPTKEPSHALRGDRLPPPADHGSVP